MINNLFLTLPIQFLVIVIGLSFLYISWMMVILIMTRLKSIEIQKSLSLVQENISHHQGCHIENLPLISDVFDSAPRRLAKAYEDMVETSVELYQKKWIPNPREFLNFGTIVDRSTAKRLTGYGFLYYTISGIMLCVLTILTGLFMFNTKAEFVACIEISLIPLIFGLLFSLIFHIENSHNKSAIKDSIDSMISNLSRKLPVFNEYNGLAILINQFLEYDRSMNKSIEKLSDQIDRFVMDGLKNAIVESIERTLLESVAPSIERATSAIVSLSNDVMEKEENGMKDLAVKFSSALSEELYYQLEPLIKQISEVSNTLSNSKNYLDIASQSLDSYKKNALDLQELTSKTLLEYEEAKVSFANDVHSIADSIENFSQTSNIYNQYVESNQKSFEATAQTLKNSVEEAQKTLSLLIDGIFKEAQNSQSQALESQKVNEEYLSKMGNQIDSFTSGFTSHNQDLFAGLNSIISDFVSQQTSMIADSQSKIGTNSLEMLQSMEKAAKDISLCTKQIKNSFDELEAARLREEEIAKNRKTGIFGRNK